MATSFSENAGPVQVCATLTGMTAISIDLTVSATDGKSRCHVIACMMRYGLGIGHIMWHHLSDDIISFMQLQQSLHHLTIP